MPKVYSMENKTIKYNDQLTFHILATGAVLTEIDEPEYALYMRTNCGSIPCKIGSRAECEDKLTEKLIELAKLPDETDTQKLARRLADENFSRVVG